MEIIIEGKPIAKKRPRFARRGKFVMAYSDQETEEGKTYLDIRNQVTKKLDCPIAVYFMFYMPRNKSHFSKSGNLKNSAPIHHTIKPDIDNLIKFYLDILNGVAWHDDSQITNLTAGKTYSISTSGKTIITIVEDSWNDK